MNHVYGISSSQNDVVESARKVAVEVAQPTATEVDSQARFPAEAIAALGERGFFGLCLPTEFGGQGQPPRVFAAVAEELAMACASTAMIYVMHVSASQTFAASATLSDRDAGKIERFKNALFGMKWEVPEHRRLLELEGLKAWMPPREAGYDCLRDALTDPTP